MIHERFFLDLNLSWRVLLFFAEFHVDKVRISAL